jgi:hypothetical protein
MTWFADLSESTYFGEACAKHLRAVGWLEHGRPYPKASGFLPLFGDRRRVLTKLSKLLVNSWQPVRLCGWHTCDLCSRVAFWRAAANSHRNLFVPGQNTIYVCPEGILHYIRKHGYVPPAEFNRAVVECPSMGSRAYFDALKAQGGNPVIDGTCFKLRRGLVLFEDVR